MDSWHISDWGKKGKPTGVSDRKKETQSGAHNILGRWIEKRYFAFLSQPEAVVVIAAYTTIPPAHLLSYTKKTERKWKSEKVRQAKHEVREHHNRNATITEICCLEISTLGRIGPVPYGLRSFMHSRFSLMRWDVLSDNWVLTIRLLSPCS